jgi:hypothetical protein
VPITKLFLEEGFNGDHVVVTAGGKVLADEQQVSTRYQIGLARQLDLSLTGNEAELVIALPEKGLQASLPISAGVPANLRVSVSQDGCHIELSTDAPLGYA